MITGLTVTYNTKKLIEISYNSIRKFHPTLPIIIVDGSDKGNPCYEYVKSIESDITKVIYTSYNIGHGKGMNRGIQIIRTTYGLIFDSDIEMLKSPVEEMLSMMERDTFGVGWCYDIGLNGYDFDISKHKEKIKYLHPYFQLINIANYKKYRPYVHHGAPCYQTMIDIYKRRLSDKIIKHFPGLTGHTSGKGINWIGKPNKYIRHDFGGTRMLNKISGKKEIIGKWVKKF